MNMIQLDAVHLAWTVHGDGAPLILVHGSNSDYRTWEPVAASLAHRFRVIAYSRRYHWPNDPIAEGVVYSMHQHVADLEELSGALDASPAHLVGHSYGALVCLLLAMRSPQHVSSLVLAEPPAITLFTSSTPTPAEMVKLFLTRPRTAFAIAKLGATGIAPAIAAFKRGDAEAAIKKFGPAVLGRKAFARLSAERLEQVRLNTIAAEFLGSTFAALDDERLRAIHTPTLLLSGEDSPHLFDCLIDRLEQLIPNTQRASVARASHIIHEDNPAAWLATVLPFLAGSAERSIHEADIGRTGDASGRAIGQRTPGCPRTSDTH
jgi:pimeloyl-ACP methyl ester carboxylesterase